MDDLDLSMPSHGAPLPALFKGRCGDRNPEIGEEGIDQPVKEGRFNPVVVGD
jgi:hypothetical protein